MKDSIRLQKSVRIFFVLFLAIVVILIVLSVRVHISPSGRFRVSDIGSEGDAFYEFTNGQAWLVVYNSSNPVDGARSELVGSYYNKNDRWVLEGAGGKLTYLESTVWSIRSVETNGHVTSEFPRIWKR